MENLIPPPELVRQWLGEFFGCTVSGELSDSDRSPNAVALLELRARVERLEAMRETEKAAILDVYKLLDKLKTGHESNWCRIVKLEEGATCPHIVTSDEGSSYCRLAESGARHA